MESSSWACFPNLCHMEGQCVRVTTRGCLRDEDKNGTATDQDREGTGTGDGERIQEWGQEPWDRAAQIQDPGSLLTYQGPVSFHRVPQGRTGQAIVQALMGSHMWGVFILLGLSSLSPSYSQSPE